MPLSDNQKATIARLAGKVRKNASELDGLNKIYNAEQEIQHIGIAVQPNLRKDFTAVVNVPRITVDEPVIRQHVRAFYRTGDSTREDPALREAWEANNLASESSLVHTEEKIFGRTFVAVGANPDDDEHPLITAEDPRSIAMDVDVRRRRATAAFRLYRDEATRSTLGTLYTPDATYHVERGRNGWAIADMDDPVDEHSLGVVPIVAFVNRRRTGSFDGLTEMSDAIRKTATAARIITNMSVSSDSLALPHRWASGVAKEDFVDAATGKVLPTWEAYMTALKATANPDAKFGNFDAADLANFHQAVNALLSWCAAEYGLPLRYLGQQSVNPASEGAIMADESRLIGRVERMNRFDGDSWAWVMDLYERFRTGEWGARNTIRVLWRNPATPTLSQIADAGTKMRATGDLSREGMWDMLEWDEPRKAQERARLEAEGNADPILTLGRDLARGTGNAPVGG